MNFSIQLQTWYFTTTNTINSYLTSQNATSTSTLLSTASGAALAGNYTGTWSFDNGVVSPPFYLNNSAGVGGATGGSTLSYASSYNSHNSVMDMATTSTGWYYYTLNEGCAVTPTGVLYEAWVCPQQYSGNSSFNIGMVNGTGAWGFGFYFWNNANWHIYIGNQTNSQKVDTGLTWSSGTWYDVGFFYNTTYSSAWINGVNYYSGVPMMASYTGISCLSMYFNDQRNWEYVDSIGSSLDGYVNGSNANLLEPQAATCNASLTFPTIAINNIQSITAMINSMSNNSYIPVNCSIYQNPANNLLYCGQCNNTSPLLFNITTWASSYFTMPVSTITFNFTQTNSSDYLSVFGTNITITLQVWYYQPVSQTTVELISGSTSITTWNFTSTTLPLMTYQFTLAPSGDKIVNVALGTYYLTTLVGGTVLQNLTIQLSANPTSTPVYTFSNTPDLTLLNNANEQTNWILNYTLGSNPQVASKTSFQLYLPIGNYAVNISDNTGLKQQQNFTISNTGIMNYVNYSYNLQLINNLNELTTWVFNYTLSSNPQLQGQSQLSMVLPLGSYTVNISDPIGLKSQQSFTIANLGSVIILNCSYNVDLYSQSNYITTWNFTSTTINYSYQLSPQEEKQFILVNGTYNLTVYGNSVLLVNTSIIITSIIQSISCSDFGQDLTLLNNANEITTWIFNYTLSSNPILQGQGQFSLYLPIGNYNVSITDNIGLKSVQNFTIYSGIMNYINYSYNIQIDSGINHNTLWNFKVSSPLYTDNLSNYISNASYSYQITQNVANTTYVDQATPNTNYNGGSTDYMTYDGTYYKYTYIQSSASPIYNYQNSTYYFYGLTDPYRSARVAGISSAINYNTLNWNNIPTNYLYKGSWYSGLVNTWTSYNIVGYYNNLWLQAIDYGATLSISASTYYPYESDNYNKLTNSLNNYVSVVSNITESINITKNITPMTLYQGNIIGLTMNNTGIISGILTIGLNTYTFSCSGLTTLTFIIQNTTTINNFTFTLNLALGKQFILTNLQFYNTDVNYNIAGYSMLNCAILPNVYNVTCTDSSNNLVLLQTNNVIVNNTNNIFQVQSDLDITLINNANEITTWIFNYTLSSNPILQGDSQMIVYLPLGNYIVNISDSSGLKMQQTFTITNTNQMIYLNYSYNIQITNAYNQLIQYTISTPSAIYTENNTNWNLINKDAYSISYSVGNTLSFQLDNSNPTTTIYANQWVSNSSGITKALCFMICDANLPFLPTGYNSYYYQSTMTIPMQVFGYTGSDLTQFYYYITESSDGGDSNYGPHDSITWNDVFVANPNTISLGSTLPVNIQTGDIYYLNITFAIPFNYLDKVYIVIATNSTATQISHLNAGGTYPYLNWDYKTHNSNNQIVIYDNQMEILNLYKPTAINLVTYDLLEITFTSPYQTIGNITINGQTFVFYGINTNSFVFQYTGVTTILTMFNMSISTSSGTITFTQFQIMQLNFIYNLTVNGYNSVSCYEPINQYCGVVYLNGLVKQINLFTPYINNITTITYNPTNSLQIQLNYFDQHNNLLNFDLFQTFISYTVSNIPQSQYILSNLVYADVGTNITVLTYDRFGDLQSNITQVVSQFISITLNTYSLKIYNQQSNFIYCNISQSNTANYWSQYQSPSESIAYQLFGGNYSITINSTETNSLTTYNMTLNGDGYLLVSSQNTLFNVLSNIQNVNTTVGNEINNINITIGNTNSQVGNIVNSININFAGMNDSLGAVLTEMSANYTLISGNISSLTTLENTIYNLCNNNLTSILTNISSVYNLTQNNLTAIYNTLTNTFTIQNSSIAYMLAVYDQDFNFVNSTITSIQQMGDSIYSFLQTNVSNFIVTDDQMIQAINSSWSNLVLNETQLVSMANSIVSMLSTGQNSFLSTINTTIGQIFANQTFLLNFTQSSIGGILSNIQTQISTTNTTIDGDVILTQAMIMTYLNSTLQNLIQQTLYNTTAANTNITNFMMSQGIFNQLFNSTLNQTTIQQLLSLNALNSTFSQLMIQQGNFLSLVDDNLTALIMSDSNQFNITQSQIQNVLAQAGITLNYLNSTVINELIQTDLDVNVANSAINALYIFTNQSIWVLNNSIQYTFIQLNNSIGFVESNLTWVQTTISNQLALYNVQVQWMSNNITADVSSLNSNITNQFNALSQSVFNINGSIYSQVAVMQQSLNNLNSSIWNETILLSLDPALTSIFVNTLFASALNWSSVDPDAILNQTTFYTIQNKFSNISIYFTMKYQNLTQTYLIGQQPLNLQSLNWTQYAMQYQLKYANGTILQDFTPVNNSTISFGISSTNVANLAVSMNTISIADLLIIVGVTTIISIITIKKTPVNSLIEKKSVQAKRSGKESPFNAGLFDTEM
jgi:hypothetical protein